MTKIQWADSTLNPIVGCSKISDGCANCFAEKMARRLKAMGLAQYQGVVDEAGWTGTVALDEAALGKPFRWKKSRRIFAGSMCDLFHDHVPFGWVDALFATIGFSRQHTYLLLTKRPERMAEWFEGRGLYNSEIGAWPWHHVWLGVTVESEKYLPRVETLLKIPAAVRLVSIEPMLEKFGPYSLDAFWGEPGRGIDWVICGPETGPGKRPFDYDWARALRDQCSEMGVPFFFKKHDDPATPADLRIAEFPEAQK